MPDSNPAARMTRFVSFFFFFRGIVVTVEGRIVLCALYSKSGILRKAKRCARERHVHFIYIYISKAKLQQLWVKFVRRNQASLPVLSVD